MTSKIYQTSTSLGIDPLTIELNTTVKITTEALLSSNSLPNASVVTTQVADSITSQIITSILSKAVTLTSLTTKAATTVILAGEVGSPCNSYTDCLGGAIVGINGTYQTMDCVNDVCICKDPYTRVVYKPNYQCAIPNGNTACQEDIQCVGTCSFSGNQKKCTG